MRSQSEPINLVIADEQLEFSEELRCLRHGDFGIVAHARDGRAAGAMLRELSPRVVVLDLALPQRSELEAAIESSHKRRPVRLVALTAAIGREQIFEALRIGAHGLALRAAGAANAIESIREVAAGRYWFPNDCLAILVEVLQDYIRNKPERPLDAYALTPRELEIVSRITAGLSNRRVGIEFSISERTVKHHLTNIYNKIGVSNRLELAMFAIKRQLVASPGGGTAMPAGRRD